MKVKVKVKPNVKQQLISVAEDGSLIVRLRSPPIDGKANEELIKKYSKRYKFSKLQ